MPLLVGHSLDEELRSRGSLEIRDARRIALAMLEGLGALHGAGIVHRDIKPGNVFLCDGTPPVVKLLDLGIAKVIDAASKIGGPQQLTRAHTAIGTPRYLSPEAALGRRVDARTDIYGVGMVLYRMLAGRGAFDHCKTIGAVMVAHVAEEPEPPSRYATQHIPAELDALVLRAIAKDPDARFLSVEDFAVALRKLSVPVRGLPSDPLASLTVAPQQGADRMVGATVAMRHPVTESIAPDLALSGLTATQPMADSDRRSIEEALAEGPLDFDPTLRLESRPIKLVRERATRAGDQSPEPAPTHDSPAPSDPSAKPFTSSRWAAVISSDAAPRAGAASLGPFSQTAVLKLAAPAATLALLVAVMMWLASLLLHG
jgi:serine/threonine protein kinase